MRSTVEEMDGLEGRLAASLPAGDARLAAELPAAILTRVLGIHISVAVQWQRASSGDWMTHAADVSRRSNKQTTIDDWEKA